MQGSYEGSLQGIGFGGPVASAQWEVQYRVLTTRNGVFWGDHVICNGTEYYAKPVGALHCLGMGGLFCYLSGLGFRISGLGIHLY